MHSTMREDKDDNQHSSVLISSMSNLSFASLNVPECKPVDGEEEIDRKSYDQWRHMLEASMHLAGVIDEITKMNIFTIKAGPKLLDVLEGTVSHLEDPDIERFPYANAIQRLNAFFGSRDYIFMQRQKLRSLTQNSTETDVKYLKRVIAVAKLCDFKDDNLVEQVADSIQLHARNRKVRETARKILRKGGSLADLLDKVRVHEMEQMNEDLFARNHSQALQLAASIVAAGGQRNQGDKNTWSGRSFPNMKPRFMNNGKPARGGRVLNRGSFVRNTIPRIPCWRCSSRQHQPSECYAIDQNCRNCGIKGHFERACHQKEFKASSSEPVKRRYSTDEHELLTRSKKIATVETVENNLTDESVSVPSPLHTV
ncbi:uncharacterized protein LOC131435278 isoform X2 [Malaya genurostris]|nr:uncharacterized protein LOC131435278 isoform X2 [Malaya genurostris]